MPMENLTMTPATENDVDAVIATLNEGIEHKLKHDDHSWGSEGWSEQEVLLDMKTSSVYLVHRPSSNGQNELVGTFALQWIDEQSWGEWQKRHGETADQPKAAMVHRLTLAEGMHGQDLGAKMLDLAAQEVKKAGREFLRLDCSADDKPLCERYESFGFTRVGTNIASGYDNYIAALYQRPVE
jgi:GNAT superfamily N-acetyltransferase